jgi:hypothetical protein
MNMNMKLAVLSLLLSSSAAFAPVSLRKTELRTTTTKTTKTTLQNDLWGQPPEKDGQAKEMSKALPFVPRPKLLDGTLAGDVGFE